MTVELEPMTAAPRGHYWSGQIAATTLVVWLLGVLVIFEVDDPDAALAMTGVAVAGGGIRNLKFTRLMTPDEVNKVRQKGREIRGAYKPPGK